jgi:hypothetical protein
LFPLADILTVLEGELLIPAVSFLSALDRE